MTTSNNNDLSRDLARSLDSATSLMSDLLGDIKDNATSLAVLRVKLESLSDSVEALSHIVRDGNGNGSMVTRVALTEQSISQIEETFNEFKDEMCTAIKEIKSELEEEIKEEHDIAEKERIFKREKLLTKIKVLAVVAPGAIALAAMIIKLVMGME